VPPGNMDDVAAALDAAAAPPQDMSDVEAALDAAAERHEGMTHPGTGAQVTPEQARNAAAPFKVGAEGFPSALRQTLGVEAPIPAAPGPKQNPTPPAGWWGRNLAGVGVGPTNTALGLSQLGSGPADEGFGMNQYGDTEAPQKPDLTQQIEAQRVISKAAPVGTMVGYGGMLAAGQPNTMAGSMTAGALIGLTEPTLPGESRLANTAMGMGAGALGQSFVSGPRAVKAGLDALSASRQPEAKALNIIKDNLTPTYSPTTPGWQPTLAEVTQDPKISIIQRKLIASNEDFAKAITERGKQNTGAVIKTLDGLIGNPDSLEAQRNAAVQQLYDHGKQQTVGADNDFLSLLRTPAMQDAVARAKTIAANERDPLVEGKDIPPSIVWPQHILAKTIPDKQVESGLLDASGKPIMKTTPGYTVPESWTQGSLDTGQSSQWSGKGLLYIKKALDDAVKVNPNSAIQGAEKSGVLAVKGPYLDWMESKIPEFGAARQIYQAKSVPINVSQVAQDLKSKLIPALQSHQPADQVAKILPSAYANALDKLDDRIASVTGFRGANVQNSMTPQALQTFESLKADLAARVNAMEQATGPGAVTAQNLGGMSRAGRVMQRVSNAGAAVGSLAGVLTGGLHGVPLGHMIGSVAGKVGSALASDPMENPEVQKELGKMLLNPQYANQTAMKLAQKPVRGPVSNYLQSVPASAMIGRTQ
jgi:hypothetical protein